MTSDNAPMQDPNEQPLDLDESGSLSPKPKRARRAKATETAAPEAAPAEVVAEAAPVKRAAPRRRKTVDEVSEQSPAVVDVPVASVEVEADAAKPKRAPRKKAVASESQDQAESVSAVVPESAVDLPVVREQAGNGFLQLGPEVESQAPVVAEGGALIADESGRRFEERGERGRRDRGPRGSRADRPRAAEGHVPEGERTDATREQEVPSRRVALAAEQANEVFAELISGDFDTVRDESAEEVAEGSESEVQKRVLRPEPDAPKLQKVLAQSGVGSRRDIEQMIESGSITVNGEVAHIGQRVSYGDQVKVSGKPIRIRIAPQPARILAYHKPTGEVVTHDDPQGRPTVFRRLPRLQNGKWMSVGRLDLNTEGLLLFTTSGELANQLMHPRFGVEREYAVRVLGTLSESARAKLLEGVNIEGQVAAFKSIENGGGEGVNHWYRVVITEGRNREVRKLFETVGLAVSRLIRVRYGAIVLPRGLKRGVFVELGESDVRAVKQLAGFDRNDGFQQGDRNPRGGRPPQGQNAPQQHGAQQGQAPVGQGGFKGKQGGPNNRGPQGQGGRNQNQNRPMRGPMDRQQGGGMSQQAAPQGDRDRDDDIDNIGPIPNPLEQTFDKRFVKGSKRISQGFGRPDHDAGRGGQGGDRSGGPRQPDPMQTSVGYIGADAFFNKIGGRSGRGGGGGQGGGQGGGGRGRR